MGKRLVHIHKRSISRIVQRAPFFKKKTKAKILLSDSADWKMETQSYIKNCFHYIHQNPLEASLVMDPKDWPYSSWHCYYNGREDKLCNKSKFIDASGMEEFDKAEAGKFELNKKIIRKIF